MIEDIRYLIVFAKIAEAGSISGGAAALGLTTATASSHLSKLEKSLGTPLVYRNTRKLSLTQDGAELMETAKPMLELYENGFIEYKQRSISTGNALRISIPAILINSRFMQYVSDFIKDHPTLQVHISCNDIRHDIISESIDVAFRIGELPDSSLKARHLFYLPRRVVATRAFLARYRPLEHPAELACMRWIGLTMRPNFRVFKHARSGEEAEVKYTPSVQVDNVEAAFRLAQQSVGLAAPPDYLIESALRQKEVEVVLPEWSLAPLNVYAVWPSNIVTNSAAYGLINSIYDAFSSDPASVGK